MKSSRLCIVLVAVMCVATSLLIPQATVAHASWTPTASFEITSAALAARGAAIDLQVQVSCQGSNQPRLSEMLAINLHVQQRTGHRIAASDVFLFHDTSLTQFFGFSCEPDVVTRFPIGVRVLAVGEPFRQGAVSVTGSFSICDDGFENCVTTATTAVETKVRGTSDVDISTAAPERTSASIVDHGRAVDVSMRIPCADPFHSELFEVMDVSVAQVQGHRLVRGILGSDSTVLAFTRCDSGEPETFTFRVLAPAGSLFHSGQTLINAFVAYEGSKVPTGCCESLIASHPLRIDRHG